MSYAYNERALFVGFTGSGKSELVNVVFSQLRVQRLLIDTKDEFALPDVEPVHDVEAIDWTAPLIHYVPRGHGVEAVEEHEQLFAAAWRHAKGRRMVVAVHELADICAYNANRTPPAFDRWVAQGRVHGLGLLAGTQRPSCVPVLARTECEHVYLFARRLSADDHKTVAQLVAHDPRDLAAELDALGREHGRHAFVHFDRASGDARAWPPLPEHVRAGSIVTRRSIA